MFRDIIGQDEVKSRLRRIVREERTPHALMLFGPPGSGKLPLGIALARYLSCAERGEEDACGTCPSCLKFNRLAHPDLHFIFPVLKTAQVTGDPVSDDFMVAWRETFLSNPYLTENQWYEAIGAENKQGIISVKESETLIRKLGFKPYESEYRMVIIWLPEKMNRPAANKLLKLVEEPPPGTLMVMIAEHTDQILPTILSRTQLMHVPPLTGAEIREGLLRQEGADPGTVEDAVRRADGNFSTALQALGQEEGELQNFKLFAALMRLCYARKIIEINDWVEQVAALGRERQKLLLDYCLRMLRENFVKHLAVDGLNHMSGAEHEFSVKFSPFIHSENMDGLAEAFSEAAGHIEANGNPRIIFMDLSIRVIRLLMVRESRKV